MWSSLNATPAVWSNGRRRSQSFCMRCASPVISSPVIFLAALQLTEHLEEAATCLVKHQRSNPADYSNNRFKKAEWCKQSDFFVFSTGRHFASFIEITFQPPAEERMDLEQASLFLDSF